MKLELLKEYGIDWEKGLARCMDDRALYIGTLELFLEDDCLERGRAALEGARYPELFQSMHELKGVCGNVEMTELYAAVCPLVELLRRDGGKNADAAEVRLLFSRVEKAYEQARVGIARAKG